MTKRIILTKDGSPSIEWREGVTYHSMFGAVQESEHIFINEGWKAVGPIGDVRAFELGLGTGLNALLTYMAAEREGRRVVYEAVEAFPLDEKIAVQLGYSALLGRPELEAIFMRLHQCAWESVVEISPFFRFYKTRTPWPAHVLRNAAELVYYDAFDPVQQPELWTEEVFATLAQQLAPGAVLATYCCKGSVKRALQAAGFRTEKRPGPPGKREILRAWRTGGE